MPVFLEIFVFPIYDPNFTVNGNAAIDTVCLNDTHFPAASYPAGCKHAQTELK